MAKNAKQNVRKPVASKPSKKAVALTADGRPIDKPMLAAISKALALGGYKYHRASAKADVHRMFDRSGRSAAIEHAVALGKTRGTGISWTRNWILGKDGSAEFKPGKYKA